jgi:transposase
VIRLIHSMVVDDGLNLREAAIRLNAQGVHARSGRPWTPANLRDRILSDAVLRAEIVFRGKHAKRDADGAPLWGDAVHIALPRILTEDEAEVLKTMVAAGARRGGGQRAVYPLSGHLFGECGAHFSGISQESLPWGSRMYRCTGNTPTLPDGPRCGCPSIDALAVESKVWTAVSELLANPERLESLAADWVGMRPDDAEAHSRRIADLDRQIALQESTMATMMMVAAKTAAAQGLTAEDASQGVEQASAGLSAELSQLRQMRAEAQAWLADIEEADRRAHDLRSLAESARHRMPALEPERQAEVLALLGVKAHVMGRAPMRRGGVPCAVRAWYRRRSHGIPAEALTDAQWASVEALLPAGRGDTMRRVLDAIFCKARTGCSWPSLRDSHGSPSTASKCFSGWTADGTWDRLVSVLVETGAEHVPVPELDLVPPLRIEGRVDPRLIMQADGASPSASPASGSPVMSCGRSAVPPVSAPTRAGRPSSAMSSG